MFRNVFCVLIFLFGFLLFISMTHASEVETIIEQLKIDLQKNKLLETVKSNLKDGENLDDVIAFAIDFTLKVKLGLEYAPVPRTTEFNDVVKTLNLWCWIPFPIIKKKPKEKAMLERNRLFLVEGAYKRALVTEVQKKVISAIKLKYYESLGFTRLTARPTVSLSQVININSFKKAFKTQ